MVWIQKSKINFPTPTYFYFSCNGWLVAKEHNVFLPSYLPFTSHFPSGFVCCVFWLICLLPSLTRPSLRFRTVPLDDFSQTNSSATCSNSKSIYSSRPSFISRPSIGPAFSLVPLVPAQRTHDEATKKKLRIWNFQLLIMPPPRSHSCFL